MTSATILLLAMNLGEMNYVRGCINQIEAVRPEMPTVRENGCWTATDNYVVRILRRRCLPRRCLMLIRRVWPIDLGTFKPRNRSTAFATNAMDATKPDDR